MELKDIEAMDARFFGAREKEVFEILRTKSPVHWQAPMDGGTGFWVISRYHDTVAVLRRPETFSSEYGNILPTFDRRDFTAGLMTFTTDPPAHTRLRTLIMPALSSKSVKRRRPFIAKTVKRILDDIPEDESFDFISVVASRLPIAVAAGLIGVPDSDLPSIMDLVHRSHGSKENDYMVNPGTRRAGSSSANLELLGYLGDMVARRRKEPEDDLMSAFALAEAGGKGLSDEEIAVNCFALTLGGYQADRNAMGGAMAALIEHPDQLDLLAAAPDREIIPLAVEELLRWTTPTITLARVAMRDTEISGVPISAMDRVSVWPISANRDPGVFPDPHKFLVTRQPNRHVAFGIGSHLCAGAHVARTEMMLILDFLISKGLRPEFADAPTLLDSHFQRGFTKLPLRMIRR